MLRVPSSPSTCSLTTKSIFTKWILLVMGTILLMTYSCKARQYGWPNNFQLSSVAFAIPKKSQRHNHLNIRGGNSSMEDDLSIANDDTTQTDANEIISSFHEELQRVRSEMVAEAIEEMDSLRQELLEKMKQQRKQLYLHKKTVQEDSVDVMDVNPDEMIEVESPIDMQEKDEAPSASNVLDIDPDELVELKAPMEYVDEIPSSLMDDTNKFVMGDTDESDYEVLDKLNDKSWNKHQNNQIQQQSDSFDNHNMDDAHIYKELTVEAEETVEYESLIDKTGSDFENIVEENEECSEEISLPEIDDISRNVSSLDVEEPSFIEETVDPVIECNQELNNDTNENLFPDEESEQSSVESKKKKKGKKKRKKSKKKKKSKTKSKSKEKKISEYSIQNLSVTKERIGEALENDQNGKTNKSLTIWSSIKSILLLVVIILTHSMISKILQNLSASTK